MQDTAFVLADFAGEWRLSRVIRQADGTAQRAEGTARLTPDAEGLTYDEEGLLHLSQAQSLRFTRRYLWRPAPGGIAVLFDTGRPFHVFGPARLTDRHDCAPDTYDVAYAVAPDYWSATWRVRGPRKDYEMRSRYAR